MNNRSSVDIHTQANMERERIISIITRPVNFTTLLLFLGVGLNHGIMDHTATELDSFFFLGVVFNGSISMIF